MEITRLAEIAVEKVSSEKNPSPHMYLDRVRRNLMALLCKDEILEIAGTVEDFGGMESLTEDIKKAVLNLFCLASFLKLDLALALEVDFGATAKTEETGKPGHTAAKEKAPPPSGNGGRQGDKESRDSAAPDSGKAAASAAGASGGPSSGNGKEHLKEMFRKVFREAVSLEQVENTWKKEIAGHKDFDGKDKAELQPEYAAAKKRLSGK